MGCLPAEFCPGGPAGNQEWLCKGALIQASCGGLVSDHPTTTGCRTAYALIAVTAVLLFAIRVTAPADLADRYHQERQAAYVLDILQNGHWICQRDPHGEIASKPPLHAWVSATASSLFGGFSWFALVLPGGLAAAGTALLLARAARGAATLEVGLVAGVIFLVSPVGVRQVVQGRIDGLFAFTVVLTALAGWAAWRRGRGWIWFWLAGALATLAKGPLGLVLGATGLLAVFWERRPGGARPAAIQVWPGFFLWFAISAGWLALAYWQWGQPVLDKVVGGELVAHAVKGNRGTVAPLREFYMPAVNVLSRFAPWSLLTFWGLWRIWRQPSENEWRRRFERFVFWWFVGGLFVFSVAAHQRPDLIYPLIPPAALIAADQLLHLLRGRANLSILKLAAVIAMLGVGMTAIQYQWLRRDHPSVKRTTAMRGLADHVQDRVGKNFPLMHVDEPYAVQAFLDTMFPYVRPERAAELLGGRRSAFVVTTNLAAMRTGTNNVHILYETSGPEKAYLVSNHPRLEWTDQMVFDIGSLSVELERTRTRALRLDAFVVDGPAGASLTIENRGGTTRTITVDWNGEPSERARVYLQAGERRTTRRAESSKP